VTSDDIETIDYLPNQPDLLDSKDEISTKITLAGSKWTIELGCRGASEYVTPQFMNVCGGLEHVYCPFNRNKQLEDIVSFVGLRITFIVGEGSSVTHLYVALDSTSICWFGGESVCSSVEIIQCPTQIFNIRLGSSANYFALTPGYRLLSKARPNWMSTLPDKKPIISINIPGTHDSAAISFDPSPGPYACQAASLTRQRSTKTSGLT
jgi:hypothetical protein